MEKINLEQLSLFIRRNSIVFDKQENKDSFKMFMIDLNGRFIITYDGEKIHEGNDRMKAIDIYNSINI